MDQESLTMHSQRVESLSQAQRESLAYIDFRLYYMGEVGRPDLTSRFGLAPAALSQPDLCSQGQKGHQRLQKSGWSARGLGRTHGVLLRGSVRFSGRMRHGRRWLL
ncbi:hypothetical protein THICB2_480043 [Thiomonas sp. CB2]|nr:hypothetical protein THICB2_480043 [Thiomonas sp. CB2]VDY04384.1 protein of unknown function [Thiomonas sp. Bio17B3]VDY12635.1 conserved protein of unknown function [Thiomonas sp. OC7]VDY18155.1 protein of unknown function [Thiomonas sp. CB2]